MKIFQFLKDGDNAFSSKRLFGLGCLVMAVALSFLHPDNVPLIGLWLGAGAGVFGIQAFTNT